MGKVGPVGVYAILNFGGAGCVAYIGSTIALKRRWRQHRALLRRGHHDNSRLQRDWDRYSEDVFGFEILETVDDPKALVGCEQCWLDKCRSMMPVYNLANPKDHWSFTLTEETRQAISKAQMGRRHSEETKRRISEANKGRVIPEHTRRAVAEANRRRVHSEETRYKLSLANKGKVRSEEHRRKIGVTFAKNYPRFRNERTGEVIPAGRNLQAMCREHRLCPSSMRGVKNGHWRQSKGWILDEGEIDCEYIRFGREKQR